MAASPYFPSVTLNIRDPATGVSPSGPFVERSSKNLNMRKAKYRVYARHSGGHAQFDGSSTERQTDMEVHRRRAEELGAELVDVAYIDRGKSGFYGDNLEAELGRIKAEIESGIIVKGDIIRVESHSRLGRLHPVEAITQYFDFLRARIRLDIKDRGLRSWQSIGGEQGYQALSMDFSDIWLAYAESLQKSKHGRDTNAIKRKKLLAGQKEGVMLHGRPGCFVGDRCPAWLEPLVKMDPETGFMYRLIESVASVVQMIFDWREAGLGSYVIAQRLTQMKVEPFANYHRVKEEKKVQGWSASMVVGVLRNLTVLGLYQPNTVELPRDEDGEPIRGKRIRVKQTEKPMAYYPSALSDPQQFWRVQRLIDEADTATGERGGSKGRNGKYFGNIIKGIGCCEYCDGPVWLWMRSPKPGARPRKDTPAKELRCENARRNVIFPEGHRLAGQKCPNRKGMSYSEFEAALFSLFRPAMIPVLGEMIPQKHRDDLLTRRRSDCEAKIDESEQGIRRLVRQVAKAESDEIADAYDVEIKALEADLSRLRTERDRLQQQARSHDEEHEKQIAAVIARLTDTSEPQARSDARAQLNQLLKNHIDITLHQDRSITVRINAHSGLAPVDARLTLDGLDSIDVIDRDGSVLTHYNRSGLVLLDPISPEQRAA